MAFEPKTKVGTKLTNLELAKLFGVSNQGGMRRSLKNNCLVITTDPEGTLYQDRQRGPILYYTGMGQRGHQSLDFQQNKTLANSAIWGIRVFLFEQLKPSGYKFKGEVQLISTPFQEPQKDIDQKLRDVWMFPLKFVDKEIDLSVSQEINDLIPQNEKSFLEGKLRLVTHWKKERNQKLVAEAKAKYDWVCDICALRFEEKYGVKYIEGHHKEPLSISPENKVVTIADIALLCPNCHKAVHKHMVIHQKWGYEQIKRNLHFVRKDD